MSTLAPEAASASPMPEGVTDPNYRPAPGYLGNLTVVQLHTLEKLKKELKEEEKFVEERMDDATLLRYFSFCSVIVLYAGRVHWLESCYLIGAALAPVLRISPDSLSHDTNLQRL